MRIELNEPFKSDWRIAYLRHDKDKRRKVDLFNSNKKRTTTSYARYLLSIKLGRYLTPEEEVDHIDGDKTNDSIENLQVLSKHNHRLKTANGKSRTSIEFICPQCGKTFHREKRQIKPHTSPKCSRVCNGKYSRMLQIQRKKHLQLNQL